MSLVFRPFTFIGLSLVILSSLFYTSCKTQLPGHNIKVKITGVTDSVCYLANYYGEKQYYKDTANFNQDGYLVFKGSDTLPGGVYSIIIPGGKYFEFIINEQHFTLETDTSNFVKNMKIDGSKENELFFNYLNLVGESQIKSKEINEKKEELGTDKDSIAIYDEILSNLRTNVDKVREDIINNNEGFFISAMFKAMNDPVIPEFPALPNGDRDSISTYQYYKTHFLDNIDLGDVRLLRSPILHKKVMRYIEKVVPQDPDSISVAIDIVLSKAIVDPDVFKYFVVKFGTKYEKSKAMGMDAVFVHMAFNYYLTDKVTWVDSTQLATIKERATILKPLLLGKKINNLVLADASGNDVSLYDIKSKYTVLWFWDPDCGHCKKATPKLKEIYEKYSREDLEVYAVGIMPEIEDWNDFIQENELNWINVNDVKRTVDLRKKFDIYSTPVVFVLDDHMKIVAKRITIESLGEIMNQIL
ncbi:MAG: redoxin domain-containing protein [Flavobacteriales bacterium]|nr:redoxin domain-containing protein [Flavobacteriales bacterium]